MHEYSCKIGKKYVTSANGETYLRQYPCEGRVDRLEPKLLIIRGEFWVRFTSSANPENKYSRWPYIARVWVERANRRYIGHTRYSEIATI